MFGEINFKLPGATNNKAMSFNSLTLTSLSPSQAVVTDANDLLTSLAYTSANTASTLVERDGLGNFAAGTITASSVTSAAGTNLQINAASGQTTVIGNNVTCSINNTGGTVNIGASASSSTISIGNTTGPTPLNLAGTVTVSASSTFTMSALSTSQPVLTDGSKRLTSGTINLASASFVSGILPPANGGSGVANSATITLGGNINTANSFTTSGNFAVTQTYTGATNVTFPTSGTLATTAQVLASPWQDAWSNANYGGL